MNIAENSEEEPRLKLCERATIYVKVCCVTLIAAIIINVASLTSSYWAAGYVNGTLVWHEGLWQSCFYRRKKWICGSFVINHHSDRIPGWLQACQALCVTGLMMLLPAFYIVKLYAMLPRLRGKKKAYFIAIALTLSSGIFILVGSIVFASGYPTLPNIRKQSVHYHWSFGFEIIAVFLCFTSAGLEVAEMYKNTLFSP